MSDINWQEVETIIDQVLDLPEEQRQAFINKQCKDKPKLKGEVTQMLESIFDSEGWLENPKEYKQDVYEEMASDVQLLSSEQSLEGTEVGSYLVKEKIGEGGMGSVYLAEHLSDDIDHKVAIKIIRSGKATQENIKRFKREQQILAGLHHPGIARMYDAGATEDGFPYIIMEYVDGTPITEYCKQQDCTLHQKLELFNSVLQAVQYAHENLVIHRDLKPGNILVDNSENIKILDFGISKLLEDGDDSALTQTGARLLTPRYAAPEQVRQENITTATDLYALGIVFYQLLCGEHPFDFEDLSQYEMEQAILNQEASKPSSKTSDSKLQKQLQGDLDAIALKALRKEKDQRYRVANEFLDDLENYKKGIPVSAVEDSFRYRSQKFFKRHKKGAAIAAGVLLLLIGLTGFYTWRIAQERNQAQLEAERAEQVKEFMLNIFDAGNPDKKNFSGQDITAPELLEEGIKKVEVQLSDRPQIYIEMLISIGDALANLNSFSLAEKSLMKALEKSKEYYGSESPETANIFATLANFNDELLKFDRAEDYILEAIKINKSHYGENSTELASLYGIYASTQFQQSKYKKAKQLFLKSDSIEKTHGTDTTISYYVGLANLGETELFLGNYDQAEKYFNKSMEFFKNTYQGIHSNIAMTNYRLGFLYHNTSKYQKAETYLLKSLEEYQEIYGQDHGILSSNYGLLARNYRILGEYEKAEKYAVEDLMLTKKLRGDTSLTYAKGLNNLAMIQKAQGNLIQAKQKYEKSILLYQKQLSEDNPDLAIPMYNLGDVLMDLGDYSKAQSLLEKVVAIDATRLGPNHPEVGLDLNKLGTIFYKAQKYTQADSVFAKAKKIYFEEFPENHYRIGNYLMNYGKLKVKQNNFFEAQNYFKKAREIFEDNFDETDPRIIEADSLLRATQKSM